MQTTLRFIKYSELKFVGGTALGEGATGSVRKATYNTAHVAVKVTKVRSASADDEALRREVQLFDAVGNQENVITLFGVCVDAPTLPTSSSPTASAAPTSELLLIMEYCEYGSLEDLLKQTLKPGADGWPTQACVLRTY